MRHSTLVMDPLFFSLLFLFFFFFFLLFFFSFSLPLPLCVSANKCWVLPNNWFELAHTYKKNYTPILVDDATTSANCRPTQRHTDRQTHRQTGRWIQAARRSEQNWNWIKFIQPNCLLFTFFFFFFFRFLSFLPQQQATQIEHSERERERDKRTSDCYANAKVANSLH